MNVGYIGLGLMGVPCTLNLLKANYSVHVWARNPDSARTVLENGAIWHDSIQEVAKHVSILFTNLTNTPDVEEVLLGEKGIIHAGNSNLTVVDMSTISATATREMAKKLTPHGIELVDAPVSGGTVGAEAGTLTIMVGATKETFSRLTPVLAAMGTSITRVGECGSGQIAKSCNQIVITGATAAVAEAVTFAKAANVDFHPIREALLGGFANSRILEMHGVRMMEDNYTPGFKTVLHAKDMNIVIDLAKEFGLTLPVSSAGVSLLEKAVADGYGEQDSTSIVKVLQKS